MAAVDWFAPAEVAEPAPPSGGDGPGCAQRRPAASVRSRRKATQRRVRGHIVWMIVFALLLFGVVAVNVAVLRAHVAVVEPRRASARSSRRGTRRSPRSSRRSTPRRGSRRRRAGSA